MRLLVAKFAKSLSFLIFHMPRRVRLFLGDCVGLLWFDLLRIRRQITRDNIQLAFPQMPQKQVLRLARKSCMNWGRTFVEYTCLPFVTREWIKSNMKIIGVENFWEIHKRQKGVLLLSLHLGNGDLGCAGMSLSGIPLYLISKEFKVQWINKMWFGMRARHGTHFIPPEKSTYEIMRALKKGAGVIFVQDQFTGPPLGVEITFFGRKTGAAQGLALFALRANMEVVPVYSYRDGEGRIIVEFEKGIPLQKGENREDSVKIMTQVYTDKIETLVRKYPEQWMWIHRRWKEFKH